MKILERSMHDASMAPNTSRRIRVYPRLSADKLFACFAVLLASCAVGPSYDPCSTRP